MQTLSLADHFSTPGAVAATIAFLVIELLSIALFLIVVFQYLRVVSKHRILPKAIRQSLEGEPETGAAVIFWLYVVLTIVVTVVTVALFLFQPHFF